MVVVSSGRENGLYMLTFIPSEEMDAPESLNSSEPIWMGKTRSCGKMLGILGKRLVPDMLEAGSCCCWPCWLMLLFRLKLLLLLFPMGVLLLDRSGAIFSSASWSYDRTLLFVLSQVFRLHVAHPEI